MNARRVRGGWFAALGLAASFGLGAWSGCGRPDQQEPRKLPPVAGPKDAKERAPASANQSDKVDRSDRQAPKTSDRDPDLGEDPAGDRDETADD